MFLRLLPFLAILGLVAAPASVRPADAEQSKAPTLIVRIKSIDGLLDDVKYLGTMAGKDEQVKQADGFLKAMTENKGFEGIDTKKPLGMYTTLSADLIGSKGVVLVPVTDKKAFLDLLLHFNQAAEKGADDIYTISSDTVPVPIFLKFANNYVYAAAQNKASLENLLEPAKVFAADHSGTLSVVFHLDQIPDAIKEIALGQIDLKVADEQDKKVPGETKAQHALRGVILKDLAQHMASLVREGGDLEAFFDVDRKAGELVGRLSVAGKSGSKLAANISNLNKATSMFAALPGSHSAMATLFHWALPDDARQAIEPVIDEGIRKALANEKNETRREQAEKFLKALEPTLKSGELDAGFNLTGPSDEKLYTVVGGAKIKDGKKVDEALHDLVKIQSESDREKIQLDADSSGDVKIHRLNVQAAFEPKARAMFGDNPVYLAVRPDALLFGAGPDGLSAIKQAITAKPKNGPQFELQISFARLAALMAAEQPKAKEAAADAFGTASDKDVLRFTVAGGNALTVNFNMKAEVVKFLSKLDKPAGKQRVPKRAEEK